MSSKNIYIYGRNPVLEMLRNDPGKLEKIFIRDSAYSGFSEIKELADKNKVPVSKVPVEKINRLVGRVNDQGIVANVSSVEYVDLLDWLYEQDLDNQPCLLALDGIEDPHNFGAIIRTATAAGINGILVGKQGQAPLSPVVHKTSAGTVGRIPIIRSNTLDNALTDLKAAGFFIVGISEESPDSAWDFDYKRPLVFVLGNEGEGIKKAHSKHLDGYVSLPMRNEVESLNASVSAGILLYEWMKQHQ
jgi:23S rRNA (guanosine2251-2'-O)-methyltransferase